MIALVGHCRAGFEPEAAIDFERVARAARATAAPDAPRGRGFVVATLEGGELRPLVQALVDAAPIFVRSMFVGIGPLSLLDARESGATRRPDRVSALVAQLARLGRTLPPSLRAPYGGIRVEMPDTNDGKSLSTLAKAIAPRLASALREGAALVDAQTNARPTLHVLLAEGASAYVGASAAPWRSAWPMGIARLRMPGAAPSRSVLKLAEALQVFLGDDEAELLRAGMRAVDLGAAPGGWSWLLASRGVRVTAVDNGALRGEVADDPLVTHVRADGLTFRPRRPVDWLACDIVEQPSRIAALVARWIGNGDARRAVFNLKLPMKRRYDEVARCDTMIREALTRAGVRHAIAFRHLYHDREEVTGYCERRD